MTVTKSFIAFTDVMKVMNIDNSNEAITKAFRESVSASTKSFIAFTDVMKVMNIDN